MYRQWLIDGLRSQNRSQAALARALNLSDGAVSRMCSGGRRIQADELAKISEFLGLPVPQQAAVAGEIEAPSKVPVNWISMEGAWLDKDSLTHANKATIAWPTDPRHYGVDRYAVEMRELHAIDSVRRHSVCASVDSIGRKIRAGDTVHCTLQHPSAPTLLQSLVRAVAAGKDGLEVEIAQQRIPLNKVDVIGVVIGRTESYEL